MLDTVFAAIRYKQSRGFDWCNPVSGC